MARFIAKRREQRHRIGDQGFRIAAGLGQAHQFYISGFVVISVFARCFAQRGGIGLAIEHIVYYLESQPQLGGVLIQPLQILLAQIGAAQRTERHGGADQRAGFQAVHLFQFGLVHGFADMSQINRLPACHAEAAGSFGQH